MHIGYLYLRKYSCNVSSLLVTKTQHGGEFRVCCNFFFHKDSLHSSDCLWCYTNKKNVWNLCVHWKQLFISYGWNVSNNSHCHTIKLRCDTETFCHCEAVVVLGKLLPCKYGFQTFWMLHQGTRKYMSWVLKSDKMIFREHSVSIIMLNSHITLKFDAVTTIVTSVYCPECLSSQMR